MNTRLSRITAAVAVPALLLVAAACGDDDESTDDTSAETVEDTAVAPDTGAAPVTTDAAVTTMAPTTAGPETTAAETTAAPDTTEASETTAGSETTVGGEADPAAFCQAAVDVQSVINALDGPAGDPAALEPALAAVEASTPEEIAEPAGVIVEIGRAQAEGGEISPEDEEAFIGAIGEVTAWMSDNCDYESVDVVGVDYRFDGVPETLPAGPAIFNFANEGTEQHEYVMFRLNDDTTETVEELLALPEEEVFTKITFAGFAYADPGESSGLIADLTPGRYAAVCFIPVGSTPEAVEEATANSTEIQGPPHIMEGMVAEFTVE